MWSKANTMGFKKSQKHKKVILVYKTKLETKFTLSDIHHLCLKRPCHVVWGVNSYGYGTKRTMEMI